MLQEAPANVETLSPSAYRNKVTACWLGKAVGGTLGMPYEGQNGPFALSFYDPVPTKMLPNDDLDLQVVWACVLDKMERVAVDRHVLAQAWLDHVEFPWCEYGVAIRNLRNGLKAPLCGSFDNWYTDSMGAPIRSEIWACLAPGDPDLAAAYAYEDACVDHGREGVYSEVFLAALESLAFVESDQRVLIAAALKYLPASSRTYRAVVDTVDWWDKLGDWKTVRERILERYDSEDFTDAPMNIAFTALGWIAGGGDFGRSICIAANCGKDTDCTAATLGSLMGIIDPECVPARWLEPIGRNLVLSKGIVGLDAPKTLDEFTDLVLDLRERLKGRAPNAETVEQDPSYLAITANVAFTDAVPSRDAPPAVPDDRSLRLPGTVGTMPADAFESDVLLIRYRFALAQETNARIMFDTREECRVWLDGAWAFERTEGNMMPSFHLLPPDHRLDVTLAAGAHEIVAALRKPSSRPTAEWVVGVADQATNQWIPEAFRA